MQQEKLLKRALTGNGIFSLISALTIFLFLEELNSIFKIQASWLLPTLGGGLILFGIDILVTVFKRVFKPAKINYFIIMDSFWLLGSALLVTLLFNQLSFQAITIVDIVATIVAIFAVLQYKGLRNLKTKAS